MMASSRYVPRTMGALGFDIDAREPVHVWNISLSMGCGEYQNRGDYEGFVP